MYTYCDQFCKNTYCFGTLWDVRCSRTDLIDNKEYQSKTNRYGSHDNRTCFTTKFKSDCLQYQFAKSVAIEIKDKIEEGDEGFLRFLEKVNNKPKRTRGTKVHPVSDFLELLLDYEY